MPDAAARLRSTAAARVTHVQVALDGRWEAAVRVRAPGGTGAVDELSRALPDRGESAVEVFACDVRGCVAFVGVRFIDGARDDVAHVLRGLCDVAFSSDGSLLRVASWLSARVGTPLFEHGCATIEVGVVDAWRSLGLPTRLPIHGWTQTEPEATLLDAAARVGAPAGSVIAVEFASDDPVPHWVGVEVARISVDGAIVPSPSARDAALYLSMPFDS